MLARRTLQYTDTLHRCPISLIDADQPKDPAERRLESLARGWTETSRMKIGLATPVGRFSLTENENRKSESKREHWPVALTPFTLSLTHTVGLTFISVGGPGFGNNLAVGCPCTRSARRMYTASRDTSPNRKKYFEEIQSMYPNPSVLPRPTASRSRRET